MNVFKPSAFCLIACWLVLAGFAYAQTSTASLNGTVTDPSGSAVVGAKVSLVSSGTKTERAMETGPQGANGFLSIPPAIYTLTVTPQGSTGYRDTALQCLGKTPP